MPLQLGSRTAILAGVVTVEDTESLATWLRTRGSSRTPARVNLAAATHLHTSVLQALMAGRVQVSVPPTDPFLQTWVAPLLAPTPPKLPGTPADEDAKEDQT